MEQRREQASAGTAETGALWPDVLGAWKRLSREFRLAFLSALFMGFVVHLYVFSNLILNHDSAISVISENDHLTSGRWSLSFFSQFSWVYETPVVIASLVIFALAWTAGLTVRVLELKSSASILLTSAFLVTFPSICCIFPYLYTADAYLFALLLNAGGVYLFKRFRFGWIPAAFLMAVSVGIYQSFICYAVGLLLFDCMLELFSSSSVKTVLKKGGLSLLTIGLALVLYRVILEICLRVNGVELLDYRNMADAANSGVMDYLRALPQTYREFLKFFLKTSYLTPVFKVLQWGLLAAGVFCGVYLIVSYRLYRKPVRLGLLLLGAAMMPAALNLICIIAAGKTGTNILMHYAFVLVYVFLLKIFEMSVHRLGKRPPAFRLGKYWKLPAAGALCLCAALAWNNFCITNTAYLRMQLVYENSYSLGTRLMTRLEEMEEYTPQTPVVLVGSGLDSFGNKVNFDELRDFSGMNATLVNQYSGTAFIRAFLGCDKVYATQEQREDLIHSGLLETMPAYPAKGSIQYYNGMIVIQLGGHMGLAYSPG